jgi:hypothetical protein
LLALIKNSEKRQGLNKAESTDNARASGNGEPDGGDTPHFKANAWQALLPLRLDRAIFIQRSPYRKIRLFQNSLFSQSHYVVRSTVSVPIQRNGMNYNAKRASGWRRLVGGIAFLSVLLSGAVTGQESEAAPLGPHAEGEFASAPSLVPTPAQKRFPLSQMPAQIVLDRITPARLNTETAAQPGKPGVPFKIGFSRDLLSLKNRAQTLAQLTWQSLSSGQIAALSVSTPEALGVRLGLLIENIPATALLRFYAQETDTVFEVSGRTIMETVARNLAAGDPSDEARTYWSPLIDGPEITVEIELPTGVSPDAVLFSMPRLSHLFVSPLDIRAWQEKIGESGSCNLDSTCYSATWGNESLATARMAFNSGGNSYLCTGTLLNDSDASTVVPYFLSANHCISTQSEASSLQTYWFYRASSCNSTSLSSSMQTLVGGAALLYANSLTDTSFMRLNSTPPASAWYAAWTASLPPLNSAVTGIHNPSGDLQKISFATITGYLKCPTTPGSSSYSCSSATSSSADHLKLVWNQGITEGGSSGSGLWLTSGSSHYLIGQLHGGSSYCSAPTAPDNYGRFDVAYNTALYQWLGATGTSAYALTVSKSGSGTGTVTSADGSINCGGTCSASFTSGMQVTLTATPVSGSTFTGWSGACTGMSAACTLTMNAAQNVIAAFAVASSSRYTKIANNGADLPASALLGSGATQWACTRDNTTGLVWEVKSTDGGLRDLNKTYTNYDDPTQPQKSNGSSVTNPTQAEIDAASNSIGFLNAVNSSRLCGSSGWWMPSRDELFGLINNVYTPMIDPTFFPNTLSANFWSGSLDLDYPHYAWYVCFTHGNCMYGNLDRFYDQSIRLVNNGQSLLRPQTILFSNPPNLFTVGGTASLRASASSGLPVTISSSTPNICTFTGNTVRGEAVGLCYLMANQAGNVNFSPAPQAGIGFYIDMASVLPGAPTITSFVAESRRATIHFSPPSNTGGSPIALYTATCTASGQTARLATGTVSPLTVINLTGGVTYQCTLTATNSGGSSSTASGAVSVTAKKSSITPILMLLLD